MNTQTTPETAANAPQSLPIIPTGEHWQVIPPTPSDPILTSLDRLIWATDRMAEEIEKLKSML
jgi:hypothetical protein